MARARPFFYQNFKIEQKMARSYGEGHLKRSMIRNYYVPSPLEHLQAEAKEGHSTATYNIAIMSRSTSPSPSATSTIPGLSDKQYWHIMDLLRPSHSSDFSGGHCSISLATNILFQLWVIDTGSSTLVLPHTTHIIPHSQILTLLTRATIKVTHVGCLNIIITLARSFIIFS